jgi:1,4-dihydroxy-2-naphthoate octaprenyltransferase
VKKAGPREWIAGARVRTLPLAIAPVALGTASAYVLGDQDIAEYRALLCLLVSVALQLGVNYANDYSDGVRGTDAFRVGPSRLVGSGAAKPRTVLAVALTFFAIAAVAGIVLVVLTQQWWMLAVGAAAILAAWFYTGGSKPYGYAGLGEIAVFVFFGLVATVGTTYVLRLDVNLESWLSGIAIGFIACAVLMVNNIRDAEQDRLAGKRTLAVRLGQRGSRIAFVVFLALPFVVLVYFALLYEWAPMVYFALLAAAPAALITVTAKTPRELIVALQLSTLTALLFGLGLAAAIAF